MNTPVHDNEFSAASDEEVYEEEECMTDDEEEVSHDHVCCKGCGTYTHIAVGKCSNKDCNLEFKFSASGYLIDGEDDGFICDEIEHEDDESSVEMEYDDDESSCSDDTDDDDEMVYDEEVEYVPKFNIDASHIEVPRRTTRSMKTAQAP
jgi:hypothetical protein